MSSFLNNSRLGHGQPLLIIHGLFGSSRNWQGLAKQFARHFDVITLDLRNHGDSFHADSMDYPVMAADVIALCLGFVLALFVRTLNNSCQEIRFSSSISSMRASSCLTLSDLN